MDNDLGLCRAICLHDDDSYLTEHRPRSNFFSGNRILLFGEPVRKLSRWNTETDVCIVHVDLRRVRSI